MRIERAKIKAIVEDVERAIKALEAKHGVEFRRKNSTYGEMGKIAFDVLPVGADGEAVTPEARNLASLGIAYGLPANALGRTFMYAGAEYKVTGLNTRRGKMPVMAKRADGKDFKFTVALVARLLK